MTYPKRLIEVDLPIRKISAHARREKSIRHGHISTLHIWWARRPLAACRAVLCASLWPDPADELCPQAFRDRAAELIGDFAQRVRNDPKLPATCDPETAARWIALADKAGPLDASKPEHLNCLRHLLLDFIADFANWDNSTQPDYLEVSRALTQAAHEALGGEPGTRPLVVDPFAGGGSIPLEALRIGADAFASDLNPVAVLLNKVVLEYIPRYGQQLADEVRKWGQWVKERAEEELAEFYPRDPDGAVPIAYLWARTITCEGPGCGAEVPLIRSLWLAKKAKRSVALRLVRAWAPALSSRTAVSAVQDEGDRRDADRRDACPTEPCEFRATRRKLPHWRLGGSVYFVTFSTRDRGLLTENERGLVLAACLHWHEECAWVYAAVVMPDHVHLLIQPSSEGEELSDILHSIKSFSAHAINRHRGTRGSVWLAESMDRIVRNDREFVQKLRYIAGNPTRKGLADTAEPALRSRTAVSAVDTTSRAAVPVVQGEADVDRRDACPTGAYPWLFVADEWPSERRGVVDFELIPAARASDVGEGTVRRGSASCPCCGYTTPVKSVRAQLKKRKGGAADARLFCVVTTHQGEQGRHYRLPTDADLEAVRRASEELERRKAAHTGEPSLVPDETLPPPGSLGFRVQPYGMTTWGDLFTPRQLLALTTLARSVREVPSSPGPLSPGRGGAEAERGGGEGLAEAVQVCLALGVDRAADISNSLCRWKASMSQAINLFGRQAIPMMWDFAETSALADAAGDYRVTIANLARVLEREASAHCPEAIAAPGTAERASATSHPLPDDAANAFVTDPPYYDAVPYADLSRFFEVWLRRSLPAGVLGPLDDADECIVDETKGKDRAFFEATMARAMAEGRRILTHDGVGLVVFAHKSTAGWEAQLQAMVDAGWVFTASWPIDTEMATRLRAQDSAALASSIHLVCRPRENPDGSLREEVGDWRQLLSELPGRIHEWMPRLRDEEVVGADAIFACLGPALEIFSRYSSVEKASGEVVTLGEYLEHVWAAVSREALSMIFEGADATGFEEDARLTAIWLWTVAGTSPHPGPLPEGEGEGEEDDAEGGTPKRAVGGYSLEYDAARKIAQGLGAHLEELRHVVEVKGDTARLLSIPERTRYLFGSEARATAAKAKRRPKREQLDLFGTLQELEEEEARLEVEGAPEAGRTALDRVHQSMVLFATNRGEALRRFLVEDGAGRDERFWHLAQALSALYPMGTDEKRWVDGVLARKKGLGL